MTDWAKEFADEILKSEEATNTTWKSLSEQFKKAVSEINAVLEGKSQTKLTLDDTKDVISLTSNLNRKASLNLDRHARTMSVVIDRTNYNFQFTNDPHKVASTSNPFLPGVTASTPIDLTTIVSNVTKAVVDLKK